LDLKIIVDWNTYDKKLAEPIFFGLSKNQSLKNIFISIDEDPNY
jgi:hypothetical protein